MRRPTTGTRRGLIGFAVGLCLLVPLAIASPLASAGGGHGPKHPKPKTVDVQILAFNDFHGNLEPPSGSSGRIGTVDAGGVEYFATHLKAMKATNRNTAIVSAGDLIGASPLLSGLFHDEPTIEAANLFDLDLNAVGNHEFDEGVTELLRMQWGGCHPVDGCQDGTPFRGADFRFLAANVRYKKMESSHHHHHGWKHHSKDGRTIFPPYKIKEFDGVKVAFIGMTLEGTPEIVSPSGISNVDFLDEADTVNKLVPKLRRKGAETIVVLIHEGGFPTGGFNECPGISGPIVDIVNRTSDEVDLFISGHTHQAYNCVIDGRPVSSAASFSRIITDIDMTLDKRSGEPTSIHVNNTIVTRDVAKDPKQTSLIEHYKVVAAPIANRVVGSITADITRATTAAGESSLGDHIADAQHEATTPADRGAAVAALMNPGGIRTDLVFDQISGGELPGQVTYGEIFAVQPFANSLVTMTLTGDQIERVLEQQWGAGGRQVILQVSNSLRYSWSASAPIGDRIATSSITIGGTPISPVASYRVTVNSFLADGGDGFSVLREGTNRLGGDVDTDAFSAYMTAHSPLSPTPRDRITQLP
jgi:5'-nucleotidase